jgi:alanyl-tRNA synthetase
MAADTAGEAWSVLEGRSRELEAVRAELEQARREAKRPKAAEQESEIVWQDRSGDVLVAEVSAARGGLKDLSDRLRAQEKAFAVIVGAVEDGKVALVVNLDDSVVARGVDAVQLVRSLGSHIGGGGGGRPTLAEAGGKNPTGLRDALEAGRDTLVAALR